MGVLTEAQHRIHARQWVDQQNRAHSELKEGRKATLASVKDQMVQKTIHKIEDEIKLKGGTIPPSVFTGFKCPWKKK